VVAREHHAQGAANATVRNIITSMRWMSSIDWLDFFESVSLVDEALRAAPTFPGMDFATRDEYRKQVELLSRGSGRSEIEVAREAVLLARNAAQGRLRPPSPAVESDSSGSAPRLPGVPERAEEDPGYYLVSKGRTGFERRLGFRTPLRLRLSRACLAHGIAGYLGGIAVLSALQLGGLLLIAGSAGAPPWTLVLLAIVGLVPASDIAVSLVHRLVPALLPVRRAKAVPLSG
jgi:cyclic beta-1,2-glucan synthetase